MCETSIYISAFNLHSAIYIGGVFNSVDYAIIRVKGSIFQKNTAQEGGVVSAAFTSAFFSNCSFDSNEAESGGVVSLELSQCEVMNSEFLFNNATRGGVFYLKSESALNTTYYNFFSNKVISVLIKVNNKSLL